MNPETLRDHALTEDDDLRDAVELLLHRAGQRRLWLLFLDGRGRLGDPLMPMADYPSDPLDPVSIEDVDDVTQAQVLAHRIEMLRELTGNAAVVLVWERVGDETVGGEGDEVRLWARAMRRQASSLGLPLRAQLLLHEDGARLLRAVDGA
ncbi:hypothetical protein RL72_00891 [Microbacterium azadirachtae]|uniref:Uncharacterized protein n=1 Tax=Microbacterium azadirachtae TaxID=582680 RepID=A0A0F0L0L0_9MICO|nr:hypothetical protein [Microbacterium azadirachtae]KJL26672.1 hypothetical protein RL72_00891 [Microbacterium azadirachtae]